MTETGTPKPKLLRRVADREIYARIAPAAGYMSQAILNREARRSAPEAIDAYDTGSRIAIRRLPPGYRKAIEA